MNLFARTFLPAAADAGMSMPAISRHIPIFRRCLGTDEEVLLVARGVRADRVLAGEHTLVLSRHRLVITHASRVTHRIRLHLDAPIHELSRVIWTPDAPRSRVEFAATAIDGIRERFEIKVRDAHAMWRIDATFARVFRATTRALAHAAA